MCPAILKMPAANGLAPQSRPAGKCILDARALRATYAASMAFATRFADRVAASCPQFKLSQYAPAKWMRPEGSIIAGQNLLSSPGRYSVVSQARHHGSRDQSTTRVFSIVSLLAG